MQISNLLNRLTIKGETAPAQTVPLDQNAVIKDTLLAQLKAGMVFEGSILSAKDGQALIGLADGQNIQARLSAEILLEQGTSMFFEVKSNEGGQIALRPFVQAEQANPVLVNVLEQAGVEVTERNLAMVQTMMEEQLPVDRASIQQMVRTLLEYPKAAPETLVQMTKFQLEINPVTVSQFENYKADRQSIMEDMKQIIDVLPEAMTKEAGSGTGMLELNRQLLEIVTGAATEEAPVKQAAENGKIIVAEPGAEAFVVREGMQEIPAEEVLKLLENSGEKAGELGKTLQFEPGQVLGREEIQNLVTQLKALPETEAARLEAMIHQPEEPEKFLQELFANKEYQGMEATEKLRLLTDFLGKNEYSKEVLTKLFSGKEYKELLGKVMEEQWLLKPEEAAQKENIEKLYRRMDGQLEKLSQLFSEHDKTAGLQKSIGNIRNNLSFMNELNHLYNYVQIPLKMAGQRTSGDLYVYTNKKSLRQRDGDLTAHLHLEMEYLGMTDVFVRMRQSRLSTHFMMEKEESFDLVMEHLEELTKRLEEKGYEVTMTAEAKEKKQDFVQDFLNFDRPVGKVRRYSFDVRA